jgi:hypothetical protein
MDVDSGFDLSEFDHFRNALLLLSSQLVPKGDIFCKLHGFHLPFRFSLL